MSGRVAIKKKTWRDRIFEIIEIADEGDKISNIYDIFMMITIVASIVPMAFKTSNVVLFPPLLQLTTEAPTFICIE